MGNTIQNNLSNTGGVKKRKQGHRVQADLKQQIIKRIKVAGIPVNQAAEEHGVQAKTIYNWLAKGVTGQPTWSEVAKLKKENKMLMELVSEITVELSQTKKKTLYHTSTKCK